jgi:hypothetical protein
MKRIEKMSKDCSNGNYDELITYCEALNEGEDFGEYFLINDYNAYAIDKAVNGNALYFVLMYLT